MHKFAFVVLTLTLCSTDAFAWGRRCSRPTNSCSIPTNNCSRPTQCQNYAPQISNNNSYVVSGHPVAVNNYTPTYFQPVTTVSFPSVGCVNGNCSNVTRGR